MEKGLDGEGMMSEYLKEIERILECIAAAPARPLPKAILESVSIFTPNEFEEESIGDVAGEVVTTLGARGLYRG